ncbi:hypothetical protein [Actinomadura sp. DC4]|uniref:hypothetical protein n=1 Tax=Actinomadura sp. DC4 TaxID=3055069 RepID=UPI0025AF859E|nr:hypothetical protein [Actinomadura sp. DC4]MDN3356775.1 hypothetical protein [Actinomadura sp. DC4]
MHESPVEPDDEQLVEELAAIRGELFRVDNKSGTLLTLAGAGFALVAAEEPQRGPLTGGLLAAGLLIAGVAMLQLLFVVRPRLGPAWARRLEGDPVGAPAGLRAWRRSELAALSRIVVAKYRMLRVAASLLMCALALMVGAQLATLL